MYTMTKMNRKTATSRIMYDILIMIGPVCLHISPPWMDLQNKTDTFKITIVTDTFKIYYFLNKIWITT